MCRNITTLRGLEPPATVEEVEAAARQYVRKVSGVQQPSGATAAAVDEAVRDIAASHAALLAQLPPAPAAASQRCRRCGVRRCGPGWGSTVTGGRTNVLGRAGAPGFDRPPTQRGA